MKKQKEELRVIDLIWKKCKDIVDSSFAKDTCKPYVMISQIYGKNKTKYLLTLIHSDKESWFEYRQSGYIDMNTNLEELIHLLYNRTM